MIRKTKTIPFLKKKTLQNANMLSDVTWPTLGAIEGVTNRMYTRLICLLRDILCTLIIQSPLVRRTKRSDPTSRHGRLAKTAQAWDSTRHRSSRCTAATWINMNVIHIYQTCMSVHDTLQYLKKKKTIKKSFLLTFF